MKNVISLGAGVQSSTMALMAAKGEIKPMPDFAIFADVGDEPKEVYDWLDYLKGVLPFPVHVVSKGHLSKDSLKVRTRQRDGVTYVNLNVPVFYKEKDKVGLARRQCTTGYKIQPIVKNLRRLANIKRGEKDVKVHQWLGISMDEVIRMKPARESWIKNVFPLIDLGMRRNDCLDWMLKNNYPTPPRSACVFCPYKSNDEWKYLKENHPNDFQKAVEFEKEAQRLQDIQVKYDAVPYLHKSCKPINEIDFSGDNDNQLDLFNNECEGMCGL